MNTDLKLPWAWGTSYVHFEISSYSLPKKQHEILLLQIKRLSMLKTLGENFLNHHRHFSNTFHNWRSACMLKIKMWRKFPFLSHHSRGWRAFPWLARIQNSLATGICGCLVFYILSEYILQRAKLSRACQPSSSRQIKQLHGFANWLL